MHFESKILITNIVVAPASNKTKVAKEDKNWQSDRNRFLS